MGTEKQEVVIVDLKMPFMSMVLFMVKWAIAAKDKWERKGCGK